MAVPDVSVIVAVYNTMPYLTECLTSLVGQSIGTDRMEIVAVDDGSTDGSGDELDRFAARHPDTVRVVHQKNSGGPAAPSNRALDLARGRYVYFIGADDHLGAEALERLVHEADTHGSDVVAGKMVGTNGRYVHQALYKRTDHDVSLYDSALPYTLANTKLFRRELVERHGLRFPEDMPVGSDQPFTIEACVRARRISVLADYTYYYAVRREDAGNITYSTNHLSLLGCTARIMRCTAALIEAGPDRDAVLARHFAWGLSKLLREDFAGLSRQVQEQVCDGIAELADAYLTERIRDGLDVRRRHRLCLAQHGAVDRLCSSLEAEAARGAPAVLVSGGRAYLPHPGFRTQGSPLPDRCYEVLGENLAARLAEGTRAEAVEWTTDAAGNPALDVSVRLPVTGEPPAARLRVAHKAMPQKTDRHGARRYRAKSLAEVLGDQVVESRVTTDGEGTVVRAVLPAPQAAAKHGVRVCVEIAGSTYEIPVPGDTAPRRVIRLWRGSVPHRVRASANGKGRLVVETTAFRPHQILARRLGVAAGVQRKKKQA